jgi:hypothetical protein
MRNDEIREDLGVFEIKYEMESYRERWLECVERIPEKKIIRRRKKINWPSPKTVD